MDLLKSTIIREADELPKDNFIPPNGWFDDSELNVWRGGIFNSKTYAYILHTFRCFMGQPDAHRIEDMKQLDEAIN